VFSAADSLSQTSLIEGIRIMEAGWRGFL
jgi:hypothetical protein